MASKRQLKKRVYGHAAMLRFHLLVLYVIEKIDIAAYEEAMDKVDAFEAEYVSRVSYSSGAKKSKFVKDYFRKLVHDMEQKAKELEVEHMDFE